MSTSDDGPAGESTPGGAGGGRFGGVRMPRRAANAPRRSPLAVAGLVVGAVVGLALLWSRLWTERLWYESVGYSSVFTTQLVTRAVMFVGAALLTGLLIGVSLRVAYRFRPIYAPVSLEQDNLERYREAIDPFRRLAFWVVPALFGLFSGLAAQSQWQQALLWLNRQPFGEVDAEFGNDIGFYVFTLPWLRFIISFLTMALVLTALAGAITHYIYGGISLQGRGSRTTKAARIHLSVLLAALVLLRGASYWLDRYNLLTSDSGKFDGIGYTDQHAVLPTKAILALAAVLCAALFLSTIWTNTWRLPIVGVSLLVVLAVVVGGLYPAAIQGLQVRPSELEAESPFIQRNIEATRAAYNLEGTKTSGYTPKTDVSPGQLREDAETVPGIRIVDPAIVSPTIRQLQSRVNYYQFPDTLDVDRYEVDDEKVDTVIAVRELDLKGVPDGQRNWVNDHSVYTHGYGVVAAYGNKRTSDGEPQLFEKNIPPTGELGTYEPRIYFGESSPDYSIVGGPKGSDQEIDYPSSGNEGSGQKKTTYEGEGGVAMGSTMRKLAYAIKYRQYNIMLSNVVNPQSRILDHREPRERVKRVAPWMTLDGNTYPVVVDGRIKWVVEGYTTTSEYPYSQKTSLGGATTDSLTQRSDNLRSAAGGEVNYIRNSVKATVDAYDGSVDLYAWDEKDPILKAWSGAFDNTVQPMSKIDGDLMSHLRYPEDLFKVQRDLLGKYHVNSASAFYSGDDFWEVPNDPTQGGKTTTPPYYLSIAMPDQKSPSFSLTSTYKPVGDKQNLSAFLAVDADPGDKGGAKRKGFGKMRLLEMPRDSTIRGPGQFQNEIESSNANTPGFETTLSQFLSIQRQQGSNVRLGNLLTLPVGGGLLYVEPIYVQAKGETSYPLQRIVVASFGNKLAWSATLDGALDELFGGSSGAEAGDADTKVDPEDGGADPSPEPAEPSESPDPSESSESPKSGSAVADVQKYYNEGQEALKKGDWDAYGEAQKKLGEAVKRLAEENPEGGSVDVSPSSTPKPSK